MAAQGRGCSQVRRLRTAGQDLPDVGTHNDRLSESAWTHMNIEELLRAALREAGYAPDAIGSVLPGMMRILQAEDVRIEMGRTLSRKEREYVKRQLGLGLDVWEIVAGLRA